ncbi:Putative methylthioribose-1-phosphate isomerase [uncultured archaeon]|nr:Putative methylthioribose-1-phosphate isomerase [uncultured archaeon]
MKVNGKPYRTIWVKPDDEKVIQIIDQRYLPHEFVIEDLKSSDDVARAIKDMHVRGAGLIGAAAGYGMYLATLEATKNNSDSYLIQAGEKLKSTRPTAVNLAWAVDKQLDNLRGTVCLEKRIKISFETAEQIADEDAKNCKEIGKCGVKLIKKISKKKKEQVNILTHCNAGWLAFTDYGSALSPIYTAFEKGISVHVFVDITGPWNQGAKLTAWELEQQGVPYTVIADNTGGHLMQKGLVDLVIVGADRITRTGDVANKIGTYLKALAAKDNDVPFYVAAPSSTFDWKMREGKEIPIEERGSEEVKYASGLTDKGTIEKVLLTPKESHALNYGFDVTPSRLITGIITERGICKAKEKNILKLFPEYKQ